MYSRACTNKTSFKRWPRALRPRFCMGSYPIEVSLQNTNYTDSDTEYLQTCTTTTFKLLVVCMVEQIMSASGPYNRWLYVLWLRSAGLRIGGSRPGQARASPGIARVKFWSNLPLYFLAGRWGKRSDSKDDRTVQSSTVRGRDRIFLHP